MKPKKLFATLAIALVVLIAGCKKDDFVEVVGICPEVISTIPANLATGVPLSQIITATFNEAMNPVTINATSYTIKQGTTPVTGAVTYTGTTAFFAPSSPLTPNTLYTGRVTTAAKDPRGNALQKDYEWTFTTSAVPLVVSTDPANNATNVVLNKIVRATFNMPMDPLTITGTTYTLKIGVTPVAGTVSYTGTTASFTPSSNLLSGTTYTATITTGAKNLAGIPLANNYVWNFSTNAPLGPLAIDLKSAGRFGIFAYSTVTNNAGPSEIHDLDVGIYPGLRSSLTGWFLVDGGPGLIFNGNFYAADDVGQAAMLLQAKNDANDAYLAAQGATTPAPATVAGDLGGQTLAPGIYKSATSLLIQSGNLTLDAQGDANAVWIFQMGTTLTSVGTGPYPSSTGGNVILTNGAQAKNVFWAVGSSATIGDFTSFNGNVLCLTSATMNSGSRAVGRFLVQNGAVVLTSTNIINKP